ncbi:MAG: hypothetical protein L3V56_10295 [Candidatus Magnetoovum sp. WYHC-5]|nr:hypothetical protein [Candidatus Magnetoovum sp. WYHC-5]
MPIFEYKCEDCSVDCEILVLNSNTVKCPECGSQRMKKKLSLFGMSSAGKHTAGGVSASSSSGCSSCTKGSCSTC